MLRNYGGLSGAIMARILNTQVTYPYNNPAKEGHKHYDLMQPTAADQVEGKRAYTRAINWGISEQKKLEDTDVNFYVVNAVSKVTTYNLLKVAHVNAPRLVTLQEIAAGYPRHFMGRADRKCEGFGIKRYSPKKRKVGKHDFFVEIYPNVDEWRVHCAFNDVIAVSHKVVPDNYERIARNHRFGCRQEPLEIQQTRHDVRALALAAVKALDLDFGAVDIMETNDCLLVLEVNTAPGFGRASTAIAYAKAFRKALALPREQELKLHTKWLADFFEEEKEPNGND